METLLLMKAFKNFISSEVFKDIPLGHTVGYDQGSPLTQYLELCVNRSRIRLDVVWKFFQEVEKLVQAFHRNQSGSYGYDSASSWADYLHLMTTMQMPSLNDQRVWLNDFAIYSHGPSMNGFISSSAATPLHDFVFGPLKALIRQYTDGSSANRVPNTNPLFGAPGIAALELVNDMVYWDDLFASAHSNTEITPTITTDTEARTSLIQGTSSTSSFDALTCLPLHQTVEPTAETPKEESMDHRIQKVLRRCLRCHRLSNDVIQLPHPKRRSSSASASSTSTAGRQPDTPKWIVDSCHELTLKHGFAWPMARCLCGGRWRVDAMHAFPNNALQ
jgi:hypothetical protein